MPKWLRLVIVAIVIVIAAAPVFVAPGIAESYGLERSTGSTIGALITMVLFAIGGAVSLRIIRRRERRQVVTEMDTLLNSHRDDGTDQR